MSKLPPTDRPLIDWDAWETPLRQFSSASGLVVSAYDAEGRRQLGPIVASRTATLLASSSLWTEAGPGSAMERRMVAAAIDSGQGSEETFGDGLRVCSLPLSRFGLVYGVLVYGWAFRDFSSPFACEQLAAQLGLRGHAVWAEVRLEPPVSDARMATYGALLSTMVNAIDGQRETIEKLNQVSRTRDLFLATVSHEMRTPLSALSMRLELMLRTIPNLAPEVRTGLESMRKHVHQEAVMVDDLIDAARTLTGQMSVVRADASLAQILRDAISTVEVNALEKSILIHVTPADFGGAITVNADAKRLQQVFWNLLFNAIKFTPVGGAVEIQIMQEERSTRIDVSDTGQGIEAVDLPRVFGAFTLQQHANPNGLGLGLYIAKHLVELHGGTLTVASAGARLGTTFTIRLPHPAPA
ncbi:MAG: sensor histidine kinase [Massilia sp.]